MTNLHQSTQQLTKTVLITGASSGIGEEIAYECAKEGYQLILWARRLDELERVASNCRRLSGENVFVESVDMRLSKKIEEAFKKNILMTGQIDILINNAGFGMTAPFIQSDLHQAKEMFDVNVMGVFYLTQLAALQMVDQKEGHIFFMASIAGKISTPKSSLYSATKAAVIAFSNSLRMELKPLGIHVTTVNPGPVDTPFFDSFDPDGTYLQNIGPVTLKPEEIARKTVRAFGKDKREINIPFIMEIGSRLHHLFPSIGDLIVEHVFDKK